MRTKELTRRFLLAWVSLAVWALPGWQAAWAQVIWNKEYAHRQVSEASYTHRGAAAFMRDALGFDREKLIGLQDANQATSESAFGNDCNSRAKLWGRRHPQGGSDARVFLSVAGLWDNAGYLLSSNADRNTRGANEYLMDELQVLDHRSLDFCKRCQCCIEVAQGFYSQPFGSNHRGIMKHSVFPEAVPGARVFFGDEAGIRSDNHWDTTWERRRDTPAVSSIGARFDVNRW